MSFLRCFIMCTTLCVLLLGWSIPVSAEQSSVEDKTVKMDEVVITASREAQEVSEVPAHITIVTAEDIEKSTARNVPEVLQTMAGVHVTDISGNQRNYTVDLRGFGESSQQNILFLVDGRRINLTDLSGPDWNLIPLERIERIEVIRGNRGSVLYGDNATAGVINVITKEGAELAVRGDISVGSYDTLKGAVSVANAHDIVSYDVSMVGQNTNGYRDNSGGDIFDLGGNVHIYPTDTFRLHVSSGYHNDYTRNPGAILESEFLSGVDRTETTHPDDFDTVGDAYVKIGAEIDILTNDVIKVETSFRDRNKEAYGTYIGGWFGSDTNTNIFIVSPQLILRDTFHGMSNSLVLGIDYTSSDQNYDSESEYFGFLSGISGVLGKNNFAFYFHDELSFGEILTVSGGYRTDHVTFKYDFDTREERDLSESAYDVGANLNIGSRSYVYGSFTHGFRYPVMDEQFSYFTSTIDMTLLPQLSNDFEVGGSIGLTDTLSIPVNFFAIAVDDEIFFNPRTYGNENHDGTTNRRGVEAGLNYREKAFQAGASYTYLNSSIDGGDFDGKVIPNVPKNRVSAFFNYTFDNGLSLSANGAYIGDRYLISDLENEFDKAEGYTLVNARVEYKWRLLTYFVNLNNIFNEEYSAFNGLQYNAVTYENEPGYYPSPKFNLLAGVKIRFDEIN